MDKDNKKLDKYNKKLDKYNKKVNKGEKPQKIYRCSGYNLTTTKSHPYLTESARKDLDDIFWID